MGSSAGRTLGSVLRDYSGSLKALVFGRATQREGEPEITQLPWAFLAPLPRTMPIRDGHTYLLNTIFRPRSEADFGRTQ